MSNATATVEVSAEGRKIIDLFDSSFAVPARIVFDVARITHPLTRSAYLQTIYWCVSEEAKARMVNEEGDFRRGNRQSFTAEHVLWMHLIHECLNSQRTLVEGKQNSHTLIRQKALYDKWQWKDFAIALELEKETIIRFCKSTRKIIYLAQQNYEQQQSQRKSTHCSCKSKSTRRRRSPTAASSSFGNIADYF